MKLETAENNLEEKVEIIAQLIGLIGAMGSEEMKTGMYKVLGKIKEG